MAELYDKGTICKWPDETQENRFFLILGLHDGVRHGNDHWCFKKKDTHWDRAEDLLLVIPKEYA